MSADEYVHKYDRMIRNISIAGLIIILIVVFAQPTLELLK